MNAIRSLTKSRVRLPISGSVGDDLRVAPDWGDRYRHDVLAGNVLSDQGKERYVVWCTDYGIEWNTGLNNGVCVNSGE